jgi:hypothetical protein
LMREHARNVAARDRHGVFTTRAPCRGSPLSRCAARPRALRAASRASERHCRNRIAHFGRLVAPVRCSPAPELSGNVPSPAFDARVIE